MENENLPTVQISRYRWIILAIFWLHSAITSAQFMEYSIISNITSSYYQVHSALVDFTSLIFIITFVIFFLPFNSIIQKYNLRVTLLISSFLTTCGCLIKLLSVSRDRFYFVLIGQFLCSLSQTFIFSIPSKLASTWFGPDQVSISCAIAISGIHLGLALGCVLSPNLVKNSDNVDQIGSDFWILAVSNASVALISSLLLFKFFKEKPAVPPSKSQTKRNDRNSISIIQSIRSMAKDKGYLRILLAFGNSTGIYFSNGIVTNQIYLYYFPDAAVAKMGLLSALSVISGGCFGSIIFGYFLDKRHQFKGISFFIMAASAVSYSFFVIIMELKEQILTFFAICFYGFFIASTVLIGFEFVTETMYPVPENFSCAVFHAVGCLFTLLYTFVFNVFFSYLGYVAVHSIVTGLLALSAVIVLFIEPILKRHDANVS